MTSLTVTWQPATFPTGSTLTGYQVFMSTTANPVPDPADLTDAPGQQGFLTNAIQTEDTINSGLSVPGNNTLGNYVPATLNQTTVNGLQAGTTLLLRGEGDRHQWRTLCVGSQHSRAIQYDFDRNSTHLRGCQLGCASSRRFGLQLGSSELVDSE